MAQNNECAGRSVRDEWLVSVARPLCREMVERYWQQHGKPLSRRHDFSAFFNDFLAAFPVRAEEEAKTRRRTLLEENRIPDGPALLIEELAGTCVEFAPVMPAAVLGIPMETAREFWWNTQKKTQWWQDGVRVVADFVRKNAIAGKRKALVSTHPEQGKSLFNGGSTIFFCGHGMHSTPFAAHNLAAIGRPIAVRLNGAATEYVHEVLWLADWATSRATLFPGSLFVAGLCSEHCGDDKDDWYTLVEKLLFHEFKVKAGYKLEAIYDTKKTDIDLGLDLDLVTEPVSDSDAPSSMFRLSTRSRMLSW